MGIKTDKRNRQVLLFLGYLLLVFMFLSEFNFHYWHGFVPNGPVSDELFWELEEVQLFNTFSFMGLGILVIILAYTLYPLPKRKRQEKVLDRVFTPANIFAMFTFTFLIIYMLLMHAH